MTILFSKAQIDQALENLAPQIVDKMGKNFMVVPVLTGGFIFAADLCRALYRVGADPEIDFLQLASYGNERISGGSVRVVKDLSTPVSGQSVLIVDDVLDSGRSIRFAQAMLMERGAASILTCVAVNKRVERVVPTVADFSLFETDGDAFLVGYGMDDAGLRRSMPDIGTVG